MTARFKENLKKMTTKSQQNMCRIKKMWWVIGYKLLDSFISQSQGDIKTGAVMRKSHNLRIYKS